MKKVILASILFSLVSLFAQQSQAQIQLKTIEIEDLGLSFKIPEGWPEPRYETNEEELMEAYMYAHPDGKMIFATHVFTQIPFDNLEEALDDFISHLQNEEDELVPLEPLEIDGLPFIRRALHSNMGHLEARILDRNGKILLCYAIIGKVEDEQEYAERKQFMLTKVLNSFKKND